MKTSFPFYYLVLVVMFALCNANAGSDIELQTEAETIIQAERNAKQQRKAEIDAEIEVAVVEEEFHHKQGRRKVVLRRVNPLVKPQTVQANGEIEVAEILSANPDQKCEIPLVRLEMIQLNAKNYDDLYSEITFRDENTEFTIWTNIALNYLQGIDSFTFDNVRYDYFGFIDKISSELEQERVEKWIHKGHSYETRWKELPVVFSEEPEYVVITEDPESVPEKLYEQTTALLTHYLLEEENLRVAYLNRKMMSAARAKHSAENPETSEDSVMLFWPEKNSRYLENAQ